MSPAGANGMPAAGGNGMSPNIISTGNGGFIQLHNSGGMMPNGANGAFPQSQGGNGNMAFPTSPMVQKQMSQPQMGYQQSPYSPNQYGGASPSPMQNVMQSMSTPTLMQTSQQHPFGNGQAMTMPQPNSPSPLSQQTPPILPPTDKMVTTNCSMPSFADQMNAAYAAYEQQQKLYDQQQQDLLKQLYISHPYPGLNDGAMTGGSAIPTPVQFMQSNQQQYGQFQNSAYNKGQQQRSPYASGGMSSPATMYPQNTGAGSGSGDSGKNNNQTIFNAAASTMPKTIPPRNGLGDVTCFQQVSSPFGDPKGYRCFISN